MPVIRLAGSLIADRTGGWVEQIFATDDRFYIVLLGNRRSFHALRRAIDPARFVPGSGEEVLPKAAVDWVRVRRGAAETELWLHLRSGPERVWRMSERLPDGALLEIFSGVRLRCEEIPSGGASGRERAVQVYGRADAGNRSEASGGEMETESRSETSGRDADVGNRSEASGGELETENRSETSGGNAEAENRSEASGGNAEAGNRSGVPRGDAVEATSSPCGEACGFDERNPEGEICRKSAECGDSEEAFDVRPEGGFTPDARDEASEGAAGFMASVLLGCLALLLPTLWWIRQSRLLFWMNMAVFPVGALAMARSTGRLGRPGVSKLLWLVPGTALLLANARVNLADWRQVILPAVGVSVAMALFCALLCRRRRVRIAAFVLAACLVGYAPGAVMSLNAFDTEVVRTAFAQPLRISPGWIEVSMDDGVRRLYADPAVCETLSLAEPCRVQLCRGAMGVEYWRVLPEDRADQLSI